MNRSDAASSEELTAAYATGDLSPVEATQAVKPISSTVARFANRIFSASNGYRPFCAAAL